jgi:uncharacterized Tic20 family protein
MTSPTEPTPPTPTSQPSDGGISQDEKTMAMLAHGLPILVGFWAPLIIWLLKKDQSPYIAEQAKEALNFQITVTSQ